MLVDDVLEVVHHCTVGDEGQRTRQMAVAELAGIRAEEAIGHGQAKNSIDIEWTSQASMLGHT